MPILPAAKREQREIEARRQRDAILFAAGIHPEQRMRTLKKAFDRLDEQLDATKSIVVDKAEVQVPDNQARLRAIEQVVDLEGVSLGKSHDSGSSGPVTITINAPWFESAPTTGSGEGHVVEIGHANLLIDNESQ